MKAIIVNSGFTPATGREYEAASYPADGLYTSGVNLYLRFTPAGCSPYVMSMLQAAHLLSDIPLPGIRTEAQTPPVEVRGISEDFVLKAMAIAQNPSLANTLIK